MTLLSQTYPEARRRRGPLLWPTYQPFGDREQSGTGRGRDIQHIWQISTTTIFKLFDGLRGQKLKKQKQKQKTHGYR